MGGLVTEPFSLILSWPTGLVSVEDMVVMMDEMGIDTGLDVDRLLEVGRAMEKILGRQLRSEAVHTGRVPKEPTGIRKVI